MRQGGILSPHFFAVYVDDLIVKLRKSGLGCYVASMFLACLFYADDVALLSPTAAGMQKMIDLCAQYGYDNAISYNSKKTKVMHFRKANRVPTSNGFLLNGSAVEVVENWKYLGFYLSSVHGKLSFDAVDERRFYYRSSNSLINAVYKPSEEVLLRLFYSNCVPILTYGIEVKEYLARDMTSHHVAINDGIRKIFGWNRWESIRTLRESFGYLDLHTIAATRRRSFFAGFRFLDNPTLKHLKRVCDTY